MSRKDKRRAIRDGGHPEGGATEVVYVNEVEGFGVKVGRVATHRDNTTLLPQSTGKDCFRRNGVPFPVRRWFIENAAYDADAQN